MSPERFLSYLADFGDSAVLIVLVSCTAAYFLWCRHYREAIALGISLFLASGIIAALKLIMLSCGNGAFHIESPSGHAALSISVYGIMGLILSGYFRGWRRYVPIVFFFLLGIAIAISRVIHNLHSAEEVLLGSLTGFICIFLIRFFILRPTIGGFGNTHHFNVYIVILILAVTAFIMHGERLPAEKFIRKTAGKIHHTIPFCQD